NLLMQYAVNQLDNATDLQLCMWWDLSRDRAALFGNPEEMKRTGRINASWQQVVAWVSGRIRTYRGGRLVAVDPFENPHEVRLPGGAAVTAIPIGSAEPLTLPRRNRGLKSVSVLMAILPRQLNDLLRERARGAAAGSGLRAPSLPRRSRSGGTRSAWAGPTPERIARTSRMRRKISLRIRLGRSGRRRTRFLGLPPPTDQHDEEDRAQDDDREHCVWPDAGKQGRRTYHCGSHGYGPLPAGGERAVGDGDIPDVPARSPGEVE